MICKILTRRAALAKYDIDWDTHRVPSRELHSLIGKKVVIHERHHRGEPSQGTLIEIYEDPDYHGRYGHSDAFYFILEDSSGNQIRIIYGMMTMIETIE